MTPIQNQLNKINMKTGQQNLLDYKDNKLTYNHLVKFQQVFRDLSVKDF